VDWKKSSVVRKQFAISSIAYIVSTVVANRVKVVLAEIK
jgi:hypothetical protein